METRTQHPEAVQTPVPIQFRKTSSPEHAIFRKEGEYWTLGHGDKSFRLKDTKGLGYLAHLLRHPGVEFHVLDLAEHAEREIDALTRELSRAVGLGGRGRRAASASERARQSITKTIKSVVERIG